ncbi:uncharacterized protein LOC121377516 isoform X1 [Gigantopelta aegis]|uniref:uncharacterized protein LOC121377516 isoform X1 n=1 Tax=Gigantopelta aegis TaxID=1735272 RepID=UPI001B888851|nr:uncharacterized protein LOC121377516 isoform X1 [Gigantopelta aegis]
MDDTTSRRSVMDALDRMSDKLDVVENEQVRMNGRIGRLEDSLYGEKSQFSPPEHMQRMEREEYYVPEQKVTFSPSAQPQLSQEEPVVYPPLPQKCSSWQLKCRGEEPVAYPPLPQKSSSWLHKGPRLVDPQSMNYDKSGMRSTYQSDYTGCYDYNRVTGASRPAATFTVPTSGRVPGTRVVAEDMMQQPME